MRVLNYIKSFFPKYQYIYEWTINLNSEEKYRELINTQGIYKDEFEIIRKSGNSCLRLKYCNKKLNQVKQIDELNNIEIQLNNEAIKFSFFKHQKNRINFLIPKEKESNSFLGQESKTNFRIPNPESIKVPFQIIAKLSKKDPIFSWLPFEEFFITYPLFTSIHDFLFLDYSNSLAPELIGNYKDIDYPFGMMESNVIHKFKKTNLEIKSIKNLNKDEDLDFEYWYCARTGVPMWIQNAEIPRCPKSGKIMKFVCQIDTSESVKVIESNLTSDKDYFNRYTQHLQFWGSGTLYIFIEPSTKVVGLIIQDT